MSARSILALIYTIDLLEKEEGIDCASVLARHGLERDKLDPSSEIGRDRELLIFTELLASYTGDNGHLFQVPTRMRRIGPKPAADDAENG